MRLAASVGTLVAAAIALAGCAQEPMAAIQVTSSAFTDGESIPQKYGCRRLGGDDMNPPLRLRDVPAGAQALALLFDDPDANGWVHWLWWDAPADLVEIPENTSAEALGATPGVNSWGRADHGGPCPPSGTHGYRFQVYALDAPLRLAAGSTLAAAQAAMDGHILAEGTLTGTLRA